MHTVKQTPFSLEHSLLEIQEFYLWHSGSQLIEMSLKQKKSVKKVKGEGCCCRIVICENILLSKNTAPSC